MIQSMTGFARLEAQHDTGTMSWEIRSVNHRYLEVVFRMPEEFRQLETELRQQLQKVLQRGKVDCLFRFNAMVSQQLNLEMNSPLLNALMDKIHSVELQKTGLRPCSAIEILQWPGVVMPGSTDQEILHSQCMELFVKVMDALSHNRKQEGKRIESLITARCEKIEQIVSRVRERRPEVLVRLREKIINRIEELQIEVDSNRLEQELVFLAQKLDVDEELDRLDSHIKEARQVLSSDKPVGRRLDFLLQEFNREANTLSSKSADIETTQAAMDIKVLIEQMREQIQNIQ